MSIRSKILIPMVMISVLTASTILLSNIMQFSSFVDTYIEGELDRAVLKVTDEIKSLQSKAHIAALYCSNDNELIVAMERKDQPAVLKRTIELYEQTGLESLSVVDTDAVALARGHRPESFGDDASQLQMVRSALSGQPVLSALRGITTDISIRAAFPIYSSEGRLLGMLATGDRLDSEYFVDGLKAVTGCEITVFVDDVRVATTLYEESGARATGTGMPGYIEQVLADGNETSRWVGLQGREIMAKHTPVLTDSGEMIGIISVGKDLNEKRRMERAFIATGVLITVLFITASILVILYVSRQIAAPINHSIDQARYDDLTGVFNRRSFEEQFSRLLKTLSRSGGTISLMMIDIDFFKDYNDTYGHIKGDECLRTVAEILTQTLSRADDLVARYGGEEFIAVLPNTDEDGARIMAERLLTGIRELGVSHEQSSVSDCVTISIGVTTGCVDQIVSGTDFIRQADFMLYESKRSGRNRYTFAPMKQ